MGGGVASFFGRKGIQLLQHKQRQMQRADGDEDAIKAYRAAREEIDNADEVAEGGACGYGSLVDVKPLRDRVGAMSPGLFKNGEGCGACFKDISSDDEWIAAKESPNEPNEEWSSVFHRDAQEEDENGDKDKEIHNLNDCELENEVRDFDDFPIDDLDGSNDIYGEGLPLEDNIHPINDNLGF
uniref:Expansin-like EG45 domain-containing protein n=1 Tax=Fagus sylvatica TaxID=28930 RepID=A0A2N9HHJ3_FAGSY